MSQKIKRSLRNMLVIAIAAALLALACRRLFPSPPRIDLPEQMLIRMTDRVLVIAPHCDDETLGAGGLIERALLEGADVKVAILTNGDGYTFAAAQENQKLIPTPADYLSLAYQRQRESRAALLYLGLPTENILFFDYPDRGLASMWDVNWSRDKPYWSRFTQSDRSPYVNADRLDTLYCGQNLVADLCRLMVEFQPTILVMPHPSDAHSDHWAAFNFVTYALQGLRHLQPALTLTLREYGYLVHRGDWPAPKGLLPGRELLPPAPMVSTSFDWIKFPLGESGAWRKFVAISCYKSQVNYMRRYLVSFARSNELFAPIRSSLIALISPSAQISLSNPIWQTIQPIITDPRSDTLSRLLCNSADLRSLRIATDGGMLFICLETHHPLSPQTEYRVFLRPIQGISTPPSDPLLQNHGTGLRLLIRATEEGTSCKELTTSAMFPAERSEQSLLISIPLARLGHPSMIFIGAESRLLGTVDRLGWTLVQLPIPEYEP